jgi:hypothetical protein
VSLLDDDDDDGDGDGNANANADPLLRFYLFYIFYCCRLSAV